MVFKNFKRREVETNKILWKIIWKRSNKSKDVGFKFLSCNMIMITALTTLATLTTQTTLTTELKEAGNMRVMKVI